MSGFRPGHKVRRIAQAASAAWWRRKKRSAGSSDPQARTSARHKSLAQKPGNKGAFHERAPRRSVVPDARWGVRSREWLAGMVERTLLRLLESLIILKNGFGFLRELWLIVRELVTRRISAAPVEFESFEKEIRESRLKLGCASTGREPSWERPSLAPVETLPVALSIGAFSSRIGLREEAELAKISNLDVEEEDLPEDHLEDQAGALRSRFSHVTQGETRG
ncbi:MAG: hypothetical protein HQL87_15425 [Magnetococcales bacterium]|nr:hypothetical protein [Magnetococcales bacterium]